VAKLSKRSLIAALTAAEIDQDSFQPDISQNIQFVYTLDSFQHALEGHYGAGFLEPADVLENAVLEFEIRNEFGALFMQMNNATPGGFATDILVWSNDTGETLTGATAVVPALVNGPASQTLIRSGSMPAAAIPVGAYRIREAAGLDTMFISGRPPGGPSRFLMVASGAANQTGFLGVRWRELSRT